MIIFQVGLEYEISFFNEYFEVKNIRFKYIWQRSYTDFGKNHRVDVTND